MSKSDMGTWLAAMRFHLSSIHQLTFEMRRRDKVAGYDSRDTLSVTIRHDPQNNCWITTSDDDWSGKDDADRQSLERDNILLQQILVLMLYQRSRDDPTPAYLMWLMEDLRMFYAGEKLEPKYLPDYLEAVLIRTWRSLYHIFFCLPAMSKNAAYRNRIPSAGTAVTLDRNCGKEAHGGL